MKNLRTIASLLLLAIVPAVLIAGPALALENGGIGGKPAKPRAGNPRSESIFVYELEPGGKAEDAVKVINNTGESKTLLVYAVDSQTSSDGAFACAQKVDSPVSVGSWITLSKSEVTLGPNSHQDVPFTLRVPQTASAGEQNGCIVIQDSTQIPAPQGNGVTLSFRSAIRVAVTVPGDITKDLSFSGPVVTELEGKNIKLSVGLVNNGNVSLDTDIDTHVTHLFGGAVRSAGGTFPVLARGQGTFNFEVEKPFWGGWYTVEATAAYVSDPRQSVGEAGQKETISSPAKRVFIAPQPAALALELGGLAVVLGAIGWLVFRRWHHRKLHANARTYTVKDGESLHAIAKKHGVSWKLIAKLNHLKAPYHTESGQKLKIPNK